MATLKTDGTHSSFYLHISSIRTYNEALELIKSNNCIYGTITREFLNHLNDYYINYGRNYESRNQVFLKLITFYLPKEYNLSYLKGHIKRFCTESLMGLPVYVYLEDYKNRKRVCIIVSERRYKEKAYLIEIREAHDIYKCKKEGKKGLFFCKKTDEGAVLYKKKGDIKYSFFSHFSYKVRLFAGNYDTFSFFTESLKNKWMTFFKPLGLVKTQQYLPGISIKRAFNKEKQIYNIYWVRNINLYNRVKCCINDDLTILFTMLENMKISYPDQEYLKGFALANKYKQIFKINKNIYVQRCDRVEIFMKEIYNEWKKDFEEIILEYQ